MSLGDFGGTRERAESGDAGVPEPAGHHRDELIADESGVVFVALDDLAADQFSGHGLKEVRADARFGEGGAGRGQVRQFRNRHGTSLPQRSEVGENAAGIGEFAVGEVVGGQLSIVQQFDHLVVEAGGAVRFDESAE